MQQFKEQTAVEKAYNIAMSNLMIIARGYHQYQDNYHEICADHCFICFAQKALAEIAALDPKLPEAPK
jgi:hypothetical protein